MKKQMLCFTYALIIVVSFIVGLGFIVAGIEVFFALGSDYVPFIKLARECPHPWQGGAFIFSGVLAACLMAIAWIAWDEEQSSC